MNNPEKLADSIVHLAQENARLSMEVSFLKSDLNDLKADLNDLKADLDAVLPPSKTNPDDDEWGDDEDEDYGLYEHPEDDEWGAAPEACKGVKPVCYMVDPPSGWKYGFPKIYKCWTEEGYLPANLDWWLEQNGYPLREIQYWQNSPKDGGSVPCRVWKVDQ